MTAAAGAAPPHVNERIARLRALLREHGLHAFLVHSSDPHSSEYAPACELRREWLTGFTGSAGTAVVTLSAAKLWTDGRYYTQAEAQLAGSEFELMRMEDASLEKWLLQQSEHIIGYDPERLTVAALRALTEALKDSPKELRPAPKNLVDVLWGAERPAMPASPVIVQPERLAGKSVAEKLEAIRAATTAENCAGTVLGRLDDVAWTLNLRGSDVEYNPVFLAYLHVPAEGDSTLFVNETRLTAEAVGQLKQNQVQLRPYETVFESLEKAGYSAGGEQQQPRRKCWVDETTNCKLYNALGGAGAVKVTQLSAVQLPKCVKNETELAGFRACHIKDGLAVVSYLAWLQGLNADEIQQYDEWTAAEKLDNTRLALPGNVGLSFSTISAIGPNGAIIHYKPERETARKLEHNAVYLVDSGGQYEDGTTDITRTVWLGDQKNAPAFEKRVYTAVLQGHLAVARAKLGPAANGAQVDGLARQPLWRLGLDFAHSTGHGVGSRLNVHEGPQSISARSPQKLKFQPGMVLSNEPGCYLVGKFGVRIEDLVAVTEYIAPPLVEESEKTAAESSQQLFFCFEPLTCVPHARALIDVAMLTDEDKADLNAYHQWARDTLLSNIGKYPSLAASEVRMRQWLDEQCAPL